jgi:hypothetical protein
MKVPPDHLAQSELPEALSFGFGRSCRGICCIAFVFAGMAVHAEEALPPGLLPSGDQPPQENSDAQMVEASDQYMRDELGVNDVTTPSIAQILRDFGTFKPIPFEIITQNDREAIYSSRIQTSLHFGSLVADGFMLTIGERQQDIENLGKALIRQSRALGVGDRLTKRSKSLLDLSSKGDWGAMREELIRTQADVEKSMIDLHDEEMAHIISLGGWLRGFQLAANSCAQNYSPERAAILGRVEIMDYYLDRLDTLNPRLKKTEFVTNLIARVKDIRAVALTAEGRPPTQEEVNTFRDLANDLEAIALGPVDAEGRILSKQFTP